MKELSFLLSLKNNLSGPLGKAQQSVDQFAERSKQSFKKIAVGAMGLWGVGVGIKGLLGPAHEIQAIMDELAARKIDSGAMKSIYLSAQKFSAEYGKSAADFVASVGVIKDSLYGLADKDLPRYAVAVNTLSMITKGSAAETAGYITGLANTFRTEAKAMGDVPFAETIASKTTYLVQTFGADMAKITALMEGAHGAGTRYGASMDEQLVVMARLGQTLGAGAGGAYEKFLKGAVDGGKALGLSFTDAQGKMLSFPDILQKLENKFGKTIDGNVKVQNLLNKEFGKGAVALTAVWGQADQLKKHMKDMGNTHGLDRATEAAQILADIWERVDQVWKRIRIAIGMALVPSLYPLITVAINGAEKFGKWMDMFPNIAALIGYVALATLSMAAAGALANITMGVSRFIWTGLIPLWRVAGVSISLLTGRLGMMAAVSGKVSAALAWLRSSLLVTRVAAWAAAAGFAAMTWPILAIIVAIAAVVVAVIKFWQPIKAFITGFISGFAEASGALSSLSPLFNALSVTVGWVWQQVKTLFGWFTDLLSPIQYTSKALSGATEVGASFGRVVAGTIGLIPIAINLVLDGCRWLEEVFAHVWGSIAQGWWQVINFFADNSPLQAFERLSDSLSGVFSELWDYLRSSFSATYNWIVSKLNVLPGVNIGLKETSAASPLSTPDLSGLPAPAGLSAPQFNHGGIGKTLNNSASTVTDNSKKIGTVNIYPKNNETFDSITESRELAAG